jgi:hypothetical protein
VICPKCQSSSIFVVPAEIRLYRNCHRTLSHPPMTPSPDVRVCLDCGWSEFSIPRSWLAAGWLRPMRAQTAPVSSAVPSVSVSSAKAAALSN